MKASTKRFIWFFGVWAFLRADSYLNYVQNIPPGTASAIANLVIWLTPLLFFKDDKK